MSKTFQKTITIVLLLTTLVSARDMYDKVNSYVINLNPKNFDSQIIANRAKDVISFVHFYTWDDGKSKESRKEIEQFAANTDGMFKIGAINCVQYKDICEKQDVRSFPAYKIYPPLPAPVLPYEGDLTVAALTTYLGKFIGNKVIEVNNNNVDNFLTESHNLPKAVLFTDKKGFPLIFKALSVQFDKKIKFGIVRSENKAIVDKYKVKKFPTILIIPVGDKKQPQIYQGENKFKPIFDFMNVFSETFFRVGEDKTAPSEQQETKKEKPWLQEKLPELNIESANEVCFKVDGIICVILLSADKPSDDLVSKFVELQNHLSPKIDRGIKYRFGWLNSTNQVNFMNAIEQEVGLGPSLLLVNPSKRKRYYIHEEGVEDESMKKVFDKLASGDLRFKNFKGNTIPDLI